MLITMMALFTTMLGTTSAQNVKAANISNFVVKDVDLNQVRLSDYKGKVLLIVNIASKCGFTPQYEGLEKIYKKYKDQGFEILTFPCNDFGKQEPGTNQEIKQFCSLNYGVSFPLFNKVHVKGKEQAPLFAMLTNNEITGKSSIKWNFEKFIIDKEGNVIDRFRSITKPESKKITSLIEKELSK